MGEKGTMKRLLLFLMAVCVLLAALACSPATAETAAQEPGVAEQAVEEKQDPYAGAPEPVAEEVTGVSVPAFSVEVNGVAVTDQEMGAYPLYAVKATATNTYGTTATKEYVGFAVSDVLAAAGVAGGYTQVEAVADDGYNLVMDAETAAQDTTLLAISEDGKAFKVGPWLAPCSSRIMPEYVQRVAGITAE